MTSERGEIRTGDFSLHARFWGWTWTHVLGAAASTWKQDHKGLGILDELCRVRSAAHHCVLAPQVYHPISVAAWQIDLRGNGRYFAGRRNRSHVSSLWIFRNSDSRSWPVSLAEPDGKRVCRINGRKPGRRWTIRTLPRGQTRGCSGGFRPWSPDRANDGCLPTQDLDGSPLGPS